MTTPAQPASPQPAPPASTTVVAGSARPNAPHSVVDPAALSIDELKARIAATSHSLRAGIDELTTRANPRVQLRQLTRIAKTTAIVGTVLFSLLAVRRRFKKR